MEGHVEFLRNLSAQSQKLARRIEAYQALLSDPVGNSFERAREIAEVESLARALPATEVGRRVLDWCATEQEGIRQAQEELRFRFGNDLASALSGSGMSARGQLPLLRVGLFTLRVDFDAGSAAAFWGPEIERLKSGLKLDPAALAKTLRSWDEKLRQRSTEPEKLLQRMNIAYKLFCVRKHLEEGGRVFLLYLLGELVLLLQPEGFRVNPVREEFVEYPRVRFSYELYRLKQAGTFVAGGERLKLHVASFDATTEKARALWVPDNEAGEGTHYSYVSFSRESQ